VCFACVMNTGTRRPADSAAHGQRELGAWSPGDTAKAATVYRQLPRWSRHLFDLLSSDAGRRFPRSAAQAALTATSDAPFGVDDACDWAAAFCAASGRTLPVKTENPASGETVYWMEQPAAELFQRLIAHPPA
jgi:Family of unknown function (DUF6416)